MNPAPTPNPTPNLPLRIDAAALADAHSLIPAASILLEPLSPTTPTTHPPLTRPNSLPPLQGHYRIAAVGPASAIDHHPLAHSPNLARIRRPDAILLPGLVNAHTHLDLTHIGPRDFVASGGFVGWVDMVRAARCLEPDTIADAVRQGIRQSLLGGVVAVGDIAGAPRAFPQRAPLDALASSPLSGVSFAEFFAIGKPEHANRARIADFLATTPHHPTPHVRLGLQPHATNTVSKPTFLWAIEQAARDSLPLMTHLAETPEERRFIAEAKGPQRELLERLGVWDDAILEHIGQGASPVAHLAPVLSHARALGVPCAVAHVNDASDDDLELLASTGAIVCYCPRASDYFRAHDALGPHRYRDMLAAGIPVALGTDSIINLPPDTALPNGPGMSTLDEMRYLFRRDHTDPRTLLAMATTTAARALALPPANFTLASNVEPAGIVAVPIRASEPDPLRAALNGSASPDLLFIRNDSCQTRIVADGSTI